MAGPAGGRTATNGSTAGPAPSVAGSRPPLLTRLAHTGAENLPVLLAGGTVVAMGGLVTWAARRRRLHR